MQQFFLLPGWSEVSAVKENRVYLFDSVNYLEQEGEKAVESLEALAEIITPRYFNFGLEGKAWLKFST
ncbi:ABC transporter substrate-binding protein [Pseudoxanthomonas sp. SGD-10]|nr:ABC transporter substrate-binding protein [Pseudoxanthomonas sp. SGD-10]